MGRVLCIITEGSINKWNIQVYSNKYYATEGGSTDYILNCMLTQNILHYFLGFFAVVIGYIQVFNQYDNCEKLYLILILDC
jgi:hypothetical protein